MNFANLMGAGAGIAGGQVGTGNALSRIMSRINQQRQSQVAQQSAPSPQANIYQAAPQYQSFAELFNRPQFDYSQVSDIYQRGAMPNNLLNRYNSLMTNLQSQQAAMVPRATVANGQMPAPPMTRVDPRQNNPYINFAQLFGGR